jgi:stearoyl-CoA desaturase (delta-9 desaturase)
MALATLTQPSERTYAPIGWTFFILMHLACLGAFFVGVSPVALAMAAALYLIRMFAITAFYHRYFSHRTFKTSRLAQFLFAFWGATAAQQGPLWWAEKHRHHHKYSDMPEDLHSPVQSGFWMSHIGWVPLQKNVGTDYRKVPDLAKFPELVWLDKNHLVPPVLLGCSLWLFGTALEQFWPALGSNGMQMLVWGFFVSTVVLYHGTFTINSLCHVWGSRRYATKDDSRNNFWLALITLGEGWHNNHHYYATSVRQGFFWWEIDVSYYLLRLLGILGIVWDFKQVPAHLKAKQILTKEI